MAGERTGLLARADARETELRERVIGVIDEEDQRAKTGSNASVGSSTASKEPDYGLPVVFVGFVLASLGNRLFQKLQTVPMYNYPITVNLVSSVMYVPLCFAYILPALWCVSPSPISEEERAIPKYKFAIMGALDCVSSVMQTLAVNFVPNPSTIVLLQQSAIPISMVISRVSFKGVRYDGWQVGGAAIVLGGIAVVLAPQLLGGGAAGPPEDVAAADGGAAWVWSVVIIVSCVPMCLSSVYKEKALGDQDVGVIYLNGWVAVFQTILAFPLTVPSAYATHLPLAELPYNVRDGFYCLGGVDSVLPARLYRDDDYDTFRNDTSGYDLLNPADSALRRADDCGSAPLFVGVYVLFNIAYNVLTVVILKKGSSNLLYLGSTILVPVSNAMFSLKCLPGHQPLHASDLQGLVVIMLGLLLYRCGGALFDFVVAAVGAKPRKPRARSLDSPGDSKSPSAPSPLLRDAKKTLSRRTSFGTASQRKATRYFGPNQLEMLQPLMEAQKRNAKHRLIKTNAQIRHSFLHRLGFTPDLTAHPASGRRSPAFYGSSPGEMRRSIDARRHTPPPPEGAPSGRHVPLAERRRTRSFGAATAAR